MTIIADMIISLWLVVYFVLTSDTGARDDGEAVQRGLESRKGIIYTYMFIIISIIVMNTKQVRKRDEHLTQSVDWVALLV